MQNEVKAVYRAYGQKGGLDSYAGRHLLEFLAADDPRAAAAMPAPRGAAPAALRAPGSGPDR